VVLESPTQNAGWQFIGRNLHQPIRIHQPKLPNFETLSLPDWGKNLFWNMCDRLFPYFHFKTKSFIRARVNMSVTLVGAEVDSRFGAGKNSQFVSNIDKHQ
jgi:hypothetical protein